MKKLLFLLVVISLVFSFTPPSGSPLDKGEHPRILITKDNINEIKSLLSNEYKSDFQRFVNVMDSRYSEDIPSKNNLLASDARNFAFLCLIDPSSISGISHSYTREQYCSKARDYAMALVNHDWSKAYDHNCAGSLETKNCGWPGLSMAIAYDWLHPDSIPSSMALSLEQRRDLADKIYDYYINAPEIVPPYDTGEKIKRENHVANNIDAFSGGFAYWGDSDLGNSYLDKADEILEAFQEVVERRELEVGEKLNPDATSWSEGITAYATQGWGGITRLASIAKHALNKDYFSLYSDLKYTSYYPYFMIMPYEVNGKYYFNYKDMNSGITQGALTTGHELFIKIHANEVYDSDKDIAGFAAWLADESPYSKHLKDDDTGVRLYYLLFKFIWGTDHIPKKTPDQAGVPLLYNTGEELVYRSSHDADDATRIMFWNTKYYYPNGHNRQEFSGFYIQKYGTLAVPMGNGKSGAPRADEMGPVFYNVFSIADDAMMDFDFRSTSGLGDVPEDYNDNSNLKAGETRVLDNENDYLYVDYDYHWAFLKKDKVKDARRQMLYLKGEKDKEFVIFYDYIDSSYEKRFMINTPFEFDVIDGSWSGSKPKQTTNGRKFKIANTWNGAHGVLYVSSLLPDNVEVYKLGDDNGCEWPDAYGNCVSYSGDEFTDEIRYLLGSRRLDIRSDEAPFLTVLQIGDYNTLKNPEDPVRVSASNMDGVLVNNYVVMFTTSKNALDSTAYSIDSDSPTKHIVTGFSPNTEYDVEINGAVKKVKSNKYGVLYFEDTATGKHTISIGGGVLQTCSDGTVYGECSVDKPYYCDEGDLVERCDICGCDEGYTCSGYICELNNQTGNETGNTNQTNQTNETVYECEDGTAYGECSTNLPYYCDNGTLVEKCDLCGCDENYSCLANLSCGLNQSNNQSNNQTENQTCSDGTVYGECSVDKPYYCDEGDLVERCDICGCDEGYSCLENYSCGFVENNETENETTTCDDGTPYGECSSQQPHLCKDGVLVDDCQSCGCPSDYVCEEDGSCVKKYCNDNDGDGYGEGNNCLGEDCDDSDPNKTTDCSEGDWWSGFWDWLIGWFGSMFG